MPTVPASRTTVHSIENTMFPKRVTPHAPKVTTATEPPYGVPAPNSAVPRWRASAGERGAVIGGKGARDR